MQFVSFFLRFRQLTLYLSWYQSLSKPQSSLDLHPLMTMWSKEQLSLINRQRRQTTCWQELERRQLPASRSLNCIIFLRQRGLVIFRSCEWVA
nr:hypothetical protein CFP56_73604 [Quercus suber]